jgi:hypothetical protein
VVERHLAKVDVESSNLFARSILGFFSEYWTHPTIGPDGRFVVDSRVAGASVLS